MTVQDQHHIKEMVEILVSHMDQVVYQDLLAFKLLPLLHLKLSMLPLDKLLNNKV
jgi:hypothetical protein